MTVAPYLLGRRGPGRAVIANDPGGSGGVTDGGFVDQPIVTTTASGNTTVKGKVKPGSFGKFVMPLATITAGRQYTFRYTPHFAQLAQQGKLAMVGFGLKNNNDFHVVGLRGDGSTGIHKYKVYGTPPNGWNVQTGHTTSDGGASANGTQAGPNYIRLVVSADGATYKFQTSPDGATWTDEFTGAVPSPFSNVSGVTTFGLALWFNNADAGPFSIDIDQFADALAPITDPSFSSTKLLLGFETSPVPDESSAARGNATAVGNAQISTAQFKFGTSSLALDGSGDEITFPDSADWDLSDANSDQFTVECFIRPHTASNQAIIGQGNFGSNTLSWLLWYTSARQLSFYFSTTGGNIIQVGTSPLATMTLDTWYHVAVDKDATGKIRLYVNGVMDSSATPADSSFFNSSGVLEIGKNTAVNDFNGYIDEVRITKGVARYASDAGFTVPTAAFPRA
jgi:hypothetical protein